MANCISMSRCPIALGMLALMAGFCCSCGLLPVEATTVPPTAPPTLAEVLYALSSYSAETRITAALALSEYGKEAVVAVPALIENLHYEANSDVRRAAVIALGELGPDADVANSDLMHILQTDDAVRVRISAAEALGQIGASTSVPTLASNLDDENTELTIVAAVSISLITGESFPDADSQHGYRLNEEGIPLIVIAARRWWEEEGKLQDWEDRNN
jgi:HEAT repeats